MMFMGFSTLSGCSGPLGLTMRGGGGGGGMASPVLFK